MKNEVKVTEEDMQNFTKRTGIPIIETSAKTRAKIEDAFITITRKLIELRNERAKKEPTGIKISDGPTTGDSKGCCSMA